ncbi:hypothetical protein EDD21DRAFT_442437 [Dissophora ornata]|nr:hypothetical protein BGZ58_005101 [Dissophora ornata]KAI8602947.1 hypothetical protein EDD21DRAFT_442437 [Dissophora ornata]
MIHSTSKAVRVFAVVFAGLLTVFLYKTIFHRSPPNHRPTRLRVDEPVVVILVHPSPSLNKAANFELKRVIARTWAKDVEDFGASVFFVGEHDGETVMRRPSEFQGRAQSLSPRFGQGSLLAKAHAGGGAGGAGAGGAAGESEYSKEEPMRKMLIPSVLENGQTDDPSGLLKAFHFFYNNTSLQAGPALRTYSFILNTDTTHYIHVENLVSTLLSSRPRRLLTMKDDLAFSGSVSEASRCSAEDLGDRAVPQSESSNEDANVAGGSTTPEHAHWTLSRTHVVSKQLVAMMGPHLHQCIKNSASTLMDSGEAFQSCVKEWVSNPLFWKDGYCGRLAALRYQAPAPGSTLSSWGSSSTMSYADRNGSPPTPQEFEEFYRMKQQERELLLQKEQQARGAGGGAAAVDAEEQNEDNLLFPRDEKREENARRLLQELTSSSSSGSGARWIVASGLTQAEDFTLVYQSLADREDEKEEYLEELDEY